MNYANLKLGGTVMHSGGATAIDGFLASIYEVDQGVSTAFLLGLHRDPTLTFFQSGLAIHAADDQYAALTYWLQDRPDEQAEFELHGTFHTPLAPVNGAMTYGLGEIRIDPSGTTHTFGISVIPESKSFWDLQTIIRQEPNGSETF